MLILTRRVGEFLMIGDEVTVTVLGVKRNQVRIGINAPKHLWPVANRSTRDVLSLPLARCRSPRDSHSPQFESW